MLPIHRPTWIHTPYSSIAQGECVAKQNIANISEQFYNVYQQANGLVFSSDIAQLIIFDVEHNYFYYVTQIIHVYTCIYNHKTLYHKLISHTVYMHKYPSCHMFFPRPPDYYFGGNNN